MKGNTSSGQEPISTLDWAYSLMFVSFHMKPIIRSQSYQLWDHSEWWRESWWVKQHLLSLKDTGIFIGDLSSPVSPKQQRNLQVCVRGRVQKIVTKASVCVCSYKTGLQYSFPNIPQSCENSLILSNSTSPPSLSWSFDMLNLLILFFFLPWWGSVPFKGVSSPPWLSKPYRVWIVFLFQTKDRGRITISLPFTLLLSIGISFHISNNHCLTTFASSFLPNRLG